MCRNCDCNKVENNTCFGTCCKEVYTCPTPISTTCLYYKLENQDSSKLYGIDAGNGTPLNYILEEFDKKLNQSIGFNFNGYTLTYLRSKQYVIATMQQFAEAVSNELGVHNTKLTALQVSTTDLTAATDTLTDKVNDIQFPHINDVSSAGFTTFSTINVVLQKLADQLSTFHNTNVVSPSLTVVPTSSVMLTTGGTQGHTLSAVVKRSTSAGNTLQILSDGLYVPSTAINSSLQNLSLTGLALSISGGNTVSLPVPQLSFNNTSLSISLGGSTSTVNLSSLSTSSQTVITPQQSNTIQLLATGVNAHTLQANAIISQVARNQLSDNTGLYVPAPNPASILSEIAASSTLQSQFCGVVSNCKPSYSFYVRNTAGAAVNFIYIDSAGVTQTQTVPATTGEIVIPNVWKVTTVPTNTLTITFLGNS